MTARASLAPAAIAIRPERAGSGESLKGDGPLSIVPNGSADAIASAMAHFVFRRAGMAALALAFLVQAGMAHGQTFLKSYEDLPLMPGLAEKSGSALLFDTPAGRVVEATAEGKTSVDRVYAFYRDTLPQLGWARIDDRTYRRENEVLTLDALPGKGGRMVVHFAILPE
ncbi:MAG: hypothetical protein K2Q10_13025 [Rhodospirillales bacterium]|nr:hypothetical protein [Rhodospirillales bacterium]